MSLLRKKELDPVFDEEQEYVKMGSSLLGIDKDQLFTTSAEQLIAQFSLQEHSVEKLEAAAYLFLLDQRSRSIDHGNTVKQLLEYVQEHSTSFSISRKTILDSLS